MNTCCPSAAIPVPSPAPLPPARARLPRFLRLFGSVAVDFSQLLYTDRPEFRAQPRRTLTHYR